ncbi:hypothetical protein LMH73_018475 [Vibrio splendidus]|nr:hypothetical protein [Vibrio splendidus]MCC4880327.1 hypothetical protein [Vibrio splendidus]
MKMQANLLTKVSLGVIAVAIGAHIYLSQDGNISILRDKYGLTARNEVQFGMIRGEVSDEKSRVEDIDLRFAESFGRYIKPKYPDVIDTYWGVDVFGDRALVIVYKTEFPGEHVAYKFTDKVVPQLGITEDLIKAINGDFNYRRPMYDSIFSSDHSKATEFVRMSDHKGYIEADKKNYRDYKATAAGVARYLTRNGERIK